MYLQLPPNHYVFAITPKSPIYPSLHTVSFSYTNCTVSFPSHPLRSLLLHLRRRVPQPSTPLTPSCPPAFYSTYAADPLSSPPQPPSLSSPPKTTLQAMSKRRRGERGPASLSTKKDASAYHIEFDNNMQPIGPNAAHFSSCIGMYVRTRLPYQIDTKDLTTQHWEGFWSHLKGEWHLENDGPKDLVFKKAKKIATNWRSKLVTKYVNAGTTPFAKYKYLEREHWDAFVAEKTSPAFVVYVN
ncbi:hypothetical protein L1987_71619 [Smallanthus sonchifolius]|uniref:Uncharacterized protein n=1 Tax=Smallanthus sonchifolius TaxID=185202 RepID=A0ACB9ATS6_9ASTR|nr:hypothetical protein L1987_71619 [Smallanthus sonchifolius]